MNLKESEEMIYTACTHYDMETQNGKLGTDRTYEGSYEQAFDTVVDELEKREKEIEELKKEIKDITSIPNNDINYDEEGNEL